MEDRENARRLADRNATLEAGANAAVAEVEKAKNAVEIMVALFIVETYLRSAFFFFPSPHAALK